jgi:hypothetical protein
MALTQITTDVVTGNVLASATNSYFANTQNGGVIPGNFITPYTLPNTAIANSSITSALVPAMIKAIQELNEKFDAYVASHP